MMEKCHTCKHTFKWSGERRTCHQKDYIWDGEDVIDIPEHHCPHFDVKMMGLGYAETKTNRQGD